MMDETKKYEYVMNINICKKNKVLRYKNKLYYIIDSIYIYICDQIYSIICKKFIQKYTLFTSFIAQKFTINYKINTQRMGRITVHSTNDM